MGRLLDLEKDPASMEAPVCFVTHTSRSDIIQGLLGHRAIVEAAGEDYPSFGGGLIIAGSTDHQPSVFIEEYIRTANFPILRSNLPMTQTLAAIKDLCATPQTQEAGPALPDARCRSMRQDAQDASRGRPEGQRRDWALHAAPPECRGPSAARRLNIRKFLFVS